MCELATEVDTNMKRLVLIRYLEAGLPRTASMLSSLLQCQTPSPLANQESWYVDNLMQPTVVVQTRALGPTR